jgi:hypothetical protein
VKTEAELPIAIEAYMEDNEIIISFLDGTEVSVGVINYKGITFYPSLKLFQKMNSLTMKPNTLENPKKSHRHEFLMK